MKIAKAVLWTRLLPTEAISSSIALTIVPTVDLIEATPMVVSGEATPTSSSSKTISSVPNGIHSSASAVHTITVTVHIKLLSFLLRGT